MSINHNEKWKRPDVLRGARGSEIYIGKECVKCGSTTRYRSTKECVTCVKRRTQEKRNPTWVKPDTEAVEKRRALEEKLEDMKHGQKIR